MPGLASSTSDLHLGGDKGGTGAVPRARFDDYVGSSWTDDHYDDDGIWGVIMEEMG